jgi:hypothetical protein
MLRRAVRLRSSDHAKRREGVRSASSIVSLEAVEGVRSASSVVSLEAVTVISLVRGTPEAAGPLGAGSVLAQMLGSGFGVAPANGVLGTLSRSRVLRGLDMVECYQIGVINRHRLKILSPVKRCNRLSPHRLARIAPLCRNERAESVPHGHGRLCTVLRAPVAIC